jgi:signal transduction histidine kinase
MLAEITPKTGTGHRDEILRKVAHELRTPLATILMTTGFVLEALLPPEPCTTLRQQLEAAKRAATLMARLVDDLLEGTTLASGRLALARSPLCAKDLFASASTLLGPIAAARRITLTFIEDAELPSFSADEGRLLQVIANLVGNAIKFSEPGGQIMVSAQLRPHCISFRVADSGHGIAAGDLAHVFDQFWQAPASRHLGVGLGLAITREIVDAHGGRIDVSSTVGEGSAFVFTIPL